MVQTETSQLTAECINWRDSLRQYREEFNHDNNRLQEVVNPSLNHEQLKQVEHLQNQFQIQLNNIHDLKQSIKQHNRDMEFQVGNGSTLKNETLFAHEHLFNEYQNLDGTLKDLRAEFDDFLQRMSG